MSNKQEFQGAGKNMNPIERAMPLMNDEEYIRERLDDQMSYFDSKSTHCQRKYKSFKRWEFFIASSIPIVVTFSTLGVLNSTEIGFGISISQILQFIVAISGVIIVIINKIVDLEDYLKKWKNYRVAHESLMLEKFLYRTRSEPYDEGDAFPLLVENVETILADELMKWKKATNAQQKTSAQKEKKESEVVSAS